MNLFIIRKSSILLILAFSIIYQVDAQFKPWSNLGAHRSPSVKIPVYNVLETKPSLINDGKSDNSILLQKLINNKNDYPSPAIFLFPKGVYIFNHPVYLKSGRIIKGEGPSKTRFISNSTSHIFLIFESQGNAKKIFKTNTLVKKGDNKLIISNLHDFPKVKYVEIYTSNDSIIIDKTWDRSWTKNLLGSINRINKISGDTLFLEFPFRVDFPQREIFVRPIRTIANVGFENFSVKANNPKMKGHNFLFLNAVNSWIDHIQSELTGRSHVSIIQSAKISVNHSFFHKSFTYGGGGHAYGVECGLHTTNCLVQNNIFDSLRHSMMVHLGANGNVFAYNYSTHPVWSEKGIPPDISVHGHYPYYNLFEGNEVEKIACTDYWGQAGPGNTFYRNRVRGEGIFIHHADKSIAIGNELIRDSAQIQISHSKQVIVKHNIIGKKVIKPITPPLPYSLYLEQKPSFFKVYKWPPFGFTQNSTNLPAKKRYDKWVKTKKKNIFVKLWHWLKNIF